jgi:hypothetical protein
LKALHETGNEVIVTPFLGDPVESLWWHSYPNPCSYESRAYYWYLEKKNKQKCSSKSDGKQKSFFNHIIDHHIHAKWEHHLDSIFQSEQGIDALLFMNIPLHYIRGLASNYSSGHGIPAAYYEGDLPTILPQYATDRGFKFDYYRDADLSDFDVFFTNSKGVIPDLKELGARNIQPLYYAADPSVFAPMHIEKDIDVSFFGYGSEFREEWMSNMITEPSKTLDKVNFSVAGKGFGIDLGNARMVGDLSYNTFRTFCCRSKICLNITRWSHTNVYASSTARPFELAAMGACVVSQPYKGIEEWFEVGRDLMVINNTNEADETYQWLLSSDDDRFNMGKSLREKLLKSHTYYHRAEELVNAIKHAKPG